ncbi:hypothetical protein SerAS12_3046 [Serratia sp. AS12]|uniref:hypothetical protein n=1 Tax=Serratia TaxID=613 RepID=UPI00020E9D64|nr:MULTISPECIES: hypothetical protein [Serratia]AEF46164.1 hypothetical protein SerAS9_3045 [Serratia plymuthica AS9]AEF51115.1 hypothetical protein SerAS12_3046 [Serratia sp. AS12]AEG28823.1 hypothetical protein SerAS13_3048 [Serratia sp. AS13]UTN94901.1 hypothetical protein NLX81_15495 [Serratia plymuthica]
MKIKFQLSDLFISGIAILIMSTILNTLGFSWGLFSLPPGVDSFVIIPFTLFGSLKLAECLYKPIRWLLNESRKPQIENNNPKNNAKSR